MPPNTQECISPEMHRSLKALVKKLNIKNVEMAVLVGRTPSSVTNYFRRSAFPKTLALRALENMETLTENKRKAYTKKCIDEVYLIRDLKSEIEEG